MVIGAIERFRGYPVNCRRVTVAGRQLEVLGPANYENLIDDPEVIARFERDEYMPYWAELWPAALLLAEAVAAWPPDARNCKPLTVLELGCGLGLVSLVALQRGHAVTASDYDEDALAFVAESARRNRLPVPETRNIDWRETYPNLRFDRIVAAEVLYEARSLRPVAEFVRKHLDPDGFALICDANRSRANAFADVARQLGLTVDIQFAELDRGPGESPLRGRLFCLKHSVEASTSVCRGNGAG
jgi:SAM-dependent methyltransferase